jgi:zinc finger protein
LNLKTNANCPVCSAEMQFEWETKELPYFGEAMLIAGVCVCGFRHSDTLLLGAKEPARFTLAVATIGDLDTRVIRSSSGTIRIPELGIDVEPGFASESYISNVEGVLDRIEGVVEFATRSAREAGNVESTRIGEEILEKICLARKGQYPLTLVLEDPLGNSAIASENAERSILTVEDISDLKTGVILLDV